MHTLQPPAVAGPKIGEGGQAFLCVDACLTSAFGRFRMLC